MHTICQGSVEGVLGPLSTQCRPCSDLFGSGPLLATMSLLNTSRCSWAKKALCGQIDGLVEQDLGSVKSVSGIYTFRWMERGRPKAVVARFTFVLTPESIRILEEFGYQTSDGVLLPTTRQRCLTSNKQESSSRLRRVGVDTALLLTRKPESNRTARRERGPR